VLPTKFSFTVQRNITRFNLVVHRIVWTFMSPVQVLGDNGSLICFRIKRLKGTFHPPKNDFSFPLPPTPQFPSHLFHQPSKSTKNMFLFQFFAHFWGHNLMSGGNSTFKNSNYWLKSDTETIKDLKLYLWIPALVESVDTKVGMHDFLIVFRSLITRQ